MTQIPYGRAICYSGFRQGQSPITEVFPTYDEVHEDLRILENDFDYIRMYHPNQHAKTVLEVIHNENIQLQVMLGMDLLGELNNPNCAWGGDYTIEECAENIRKNQEALFQLINLANEYEDIVWSVSAGNESVPDWNENLVDPQRVLYFVRQLKEYVKQPVTYCDNFYYWGNKLTEVAEEVDFISIHTYPVWTGKKIAEAFETSINEYNSVKALYPHKEVMITEAGWPTTSNGSGINRYVANEQHQLMYVNQMRKWSQKNKIKVYFFEAFDEPWKGSSDTQEPEKHWGFYTVQRQPKQIKR